MIQAKKLLSIAITAATAVFAVNQAQAASLMQVYNQALKSDPTFKQARTAWLSAKENLPIAEANLLPTINLTGGVARNYAFAKLAPNNGYYNSTTYGLTINEPLFNMANWAGIRSAGAAVKAATATYMAAAQDLMQRTASAYFAVLKAADQLHYTITQKNAVWQQLETSRQQYKVGLIAITPVYDAQASYDTAIANEISDRNALDNAIENLRAITGHEYKSLQGLKGQVPLYIPQPKNINSWVNIALQQNYGLQSQIYQVQADKETISQTAAGRYPTINAQGSYTVTNNGNYGRVAHPNTEAGQIGLSLNFPIYQGGLVTASTKQAEYNYLNSSATLEFDHRDVINKTRQAYLAVVAGISGIKADHQSVISNENSLQSTKAGYVVGTRTMVDVLQSLSQLTQAQKSYSQDQYNYISSLITLKEQAGTLGIKDLEKINSWLKGHTKLVKSTFNNSYTPSKPSVNPLKAHVSPKRKAHHNDQAPVKSTSAVHDGYGIQVYASKTKADAIHFAQQHKLNPVHIQQAQVDGKTWYKVIVGDYSNTHKAQAALRQLPNNLRALDPWVVSIQSSKATTLPKPV